MLRALDEHNKSIRPHKGAMGICPNCRKGVRAYCGEIYTHHWKHLELEHCDTWGEKESEWHRLWKSKFPLDWQEVIINKHGEQHIADIKGPFGMVLELQHSPISPETIRIREAFYGDLVWLVDAAPFKDNFKIYSLVKSQLRTMEDSYRYLIDWEGPENEDKDIIQAKKELDAIKYEVSALEMKLDSEKDSIKNLQEKIDTPKTSLQKVLKPNSFYLRHQMGFKPTDKKAYEEVGKKVKALKEEINLKSGKVQKINGLENCGFLGMEHYKYVGKAKVSPHHFKKCCAIQNESGGTLFPEVRHFNSEWDFKQTALSPKYKLLIDPKTIIEALQTEITAVKKERKKVKKEYRKLFRSMKTEYLSFLQITLAETKAELQKTRSKLQTFRAEKRKVKDRIALLKKEAKEHREASEKALIEQRKVEKRGIMKRYHGLYGYRWKYRRKSWDYSSAPLFLDFGPHIFEVMDENTFRKIAKEDFIKAYKHGQLP
ncbi:hypothetical protein MTsPCn5_40160 [Croceitalea sp. MTPC5]|uniref:hypothetical protein n=1 Tax=Croceitalea sp. MTPC5 TaxID=3056565 RepID=UPI002B3DB0D0|nr:hypothetical protein MTsPCn5_40160 [Croceitalea sp. MTPC5]